MTKSTGVGRGGYREGARRPKLPNIVKREKHVISFQAGEFAYFVVVMGSVEAAKKQIEQWVRAYPMARGETDHLLAQSPLAAELLTYLEAQSTPESKNLAEKLQSLVVVRELNELRAEGVIELPGGAYIA
jgi:hypothetical protein